MLEYQKEILERISDPDNWPGFTNGDFLGELEGVANDVFEKGTLEGYLASFLIYIQLSEEMIKVILESYYFYLQCTIFPNEIKVPKYKKLTFGQLIQELDKIMLTDGTKELINECQKLNENRNKIIHKLTKKTNLKIVEDITKQGKEHFSKIYEIFHYEYESYRISFSQEIKYLEEKIELVGNEDEQEHIASFLKSKGIELDW